MPTLNWSGDLTDEALRECLSQNHIPADFTLENPGPHPATETVARIIADAWEAGLNENDHVELLAWNNDEELFFVVQVDSGLRIVSDRQDLTEWAEKYDIEMWEPSGVELARQLILAARKEAEELYTAYNAELDKALKLGAAART